VLDHIKEAGDIFAAYSDKLWVLDGATVHVSIVCFDSGTETTRHLNGMPVVSINADLTASVDLTTAQRLQENAGLAFSGTKKYGPFDIPHSVAIELLSASDNPNGRPNSDVVKPWVNGQAIAQNRMDMWIIDFGTEESLDAVEAYVQPFVYISTHVRPVRMKDKDKKTRENWWLFQRPRPEMRTATAELHRFIVTPAVSKHRFFVWLGHPTVPDQQLVVIARDDDYFIGVLHSRIHELWARASASQLRDAESGTRYTLTTTFETFPFPWPPGAEPTDAPRVQAIAAAAAELVAQRDAWLNPPGLPEKELQKRTLTNLYNARPDWLAAAHRRLDAAVFAAYGWPEDLGDEEMLARLLALNLVRAGI
jgi:type II restriction/modification system DNA methylase subunit YeeA